MQNVAKSGVVEMKHKNIFYITHLAEIGGVETYIREIVKKYSNNFDIGILYRNANAKQLNFLLDFVDCERFVGQDIECDVFITNYETEIAEHVKAKHKYGIVHADYIAGGGKPYLSPEIEKYFGVSKIACESFTKITGIPCEELTNPLTIEKPKKVLRLLSCTRLSREKGTERMKVLADELNRRGVSFIWNVFCDKNTQFLHKDIALLPAKQDVRNFIADADFVVQLSDSEACSYTIAEALALGTPVIVTEHPSFHQQGVVNGVNGYVLPFDMKQIPAIKTLKFEKILRKDEYGRIMAEGKSNYKPKKYKVRALPCMENVYDKECEVMRHSGDTWEVNKKRLEQLQKPICYVEVIK